MARRERAIRSILVSHNDLDGAGGALFGEILNETESVPNEYKFDKVIMLPNDFEVEDDLWNLVSSYDRILLSDISIPEGHYHFLKGLGKEVRIFDHHTTSAYIKELPGCVHDETRCGTKIFFEEYIVPLLPEVKNSYRWMVHLIDIFDRWQDDHRHWEDAVAMTRILYRMKDYNPAITEERVSLREWFDFYKRKLTELKDWRWTRKEKELNTRGLKREAEVYEDALCNISVRKDKRGVSFGVVPLSGSVSMTARKLLKEDYAFLKYLIIVNTYNGLNGKISARSQEDFSVLDLFPIKGHKTAGGATIDALSAVHLLDHQEACLNYWEDLTEEEQEDISNAVCIPALTI